MIRKVCIEWCVLYSMVFGRDLSVENGLVYYNIWYILLLSILWCVMYKKTIIKVFAGYKMLFLGYFDFENYKFKRKMKVNKR